MTNWRNQPILVTGSHRGGSTWVGKMIASHPRVRYFSEPFNPDHCDCPVRHPWHHVTEADQAAFYRYLRPFFELRWSCFESRLDHPASPPWRVLRSLNYVRRRWQGVRPLVKDPMALMSAEWLAAKFQPRVVLLTRHPASFVSSLKRLNWFMRVESILQQEPLLQGDLAAFAGERQRFLRGQADLLDRAILGWRLVHHTIRRLHERHPDWLVCRHEDLSQRPIDEFARIFAHVQLDFSGEVQRVILQHSDDENPAEAGGQVHQLKRNSRENIWNWQRRLTAAEIARIRDGVGELADHFYGDRDWWSPRSAEAA